MITEPNEPVATHAPTMTVSERKPTSHLQSAAGHGGAESGRLKKKTKSRADPCKRLNDGSACHFAGRQRHCRTAYVNVRLMVRVFMMDVQPTLPGRAFRVSPTQAAHSRRDAFLTRNSPGSHRHHLVHASTSSRGRARTLPRMLSGRRCRRLEARFGVHPHTRPASPGWKSKTDAKERCADRADLTERSPERSRKRLVARAANSLQRGAPGEKGPHEHSSSYSLCTQLFISSVHRSQLTVDSEGRIFVYGKKLYGVLRWSAPLSTHD